MVNGFNHMHSNMNKYLFVCITKQARKIMDEYILKFPDQVDETILQRFCYVVQKNSTKLVEYFNQIATAYIFAFKVNLTPEFVHELSITFMSLRDYTSFASLAKIIYDKKLPLNPESRVLWIKIMKKCPDDGQRSQIRAAIEQIFTTPDPNIKKFNINHILGQSDPTRHYPPSQHRHNYNHSNLHQWQYNKLRQLKRMSQLSQLHSMIIKYPIIMIKVFGH